MSEEAVAKLAAARIQGNDIAADIRKVSEAAEQLTSCGLNKRGLILLIHDTLHGDVGKRQIEAILNALPTLAERYTTDE